jgi:hypothetical protein
MGTDAGRQEAVRRVLGTEEWEGKGGNGRDGFD